MPKTLSLMTGGDFVVGEILDELQAAECNRSSTHVGCAVLIDAAAARPGRLVGAPATEAVGLAVGCAIG